MHLKYDKEPYFFRVLFLYLFSIYKGDNNYGEKYYSGLFT